MAEVLGAVASVASLLDFTVKICGYLGAIKDERRDQERIRQELTNITGVLFILKRQAAASQNDPDTLQTLKMLDSPDGLLGQLQSLLALLEKKLAPRQGLKVITWPLRKDEARDILNTLGRQQNLLNIALQRDHFQLSQAIKSNVAEVREQVADIGERLSKISIDQRAQEVARQTELEGQRRQAILDWLSPLSFQTQQNDVFAKSQTGSCRWFLDCTEFNEWIKPAGAVLHCLGIPGAGKTYLASRIVQHLRDRLYHDNIDAAVACIYCDFRASQAQTIESLVASILEQCVRRLNPIPPNLVALYEQHTSNKTRPVLDELEVLMHSITTQGLRTYLVIDALDEYHDFFKIVNSLKGLQDCGINLLITSRPNISIENRLHGVAHVEVRAHEDDIVHYIECRLPSLQCIQKRPDIQAIVIDGVVKASDGMFLLARLHFDSLLDRASPKAITLAVKEMPKGLQTLPQVYDGVMARIQDQTDYSRDQALTVLSWLFFAKAKLSPQALQHALAIEPHTDSFDEDNISDIESLVSVCKGLVIIDQESKIVRLSHYTIQEYFEQSDRPYLQHGEKMIAIACLTYLSYEHSSEQWYGASTSAGIEECRDSEDTVAHLRNDTCPSPMSQRMPLFPYAAEYWGRHAVTVQSDIQDLALKFFSMANALGETVAYIDVHFSKIMREYWRVNVNGTWLAIQGTHLCAHFDLDSCFYALLVLGADPNARDRLGQNPLYWATDCASMRVLRLLLELPDIDLNAGPEGDWFCRSLVALAAEHGHTDAMKLLMDRNNVTVNASNFIGRTLLFLAASKGHIDIVRMLLNRQDIHPDVRDIDRKTALEIASTFDHTSIVHLLLERDDVDVNTKDWRGRTPREVAHGRVHNDI